MQPAKEALGISAMDVAKGLLDRGYMLAPSAYEIGFLSTSHDESHILGFVEALDDSLSNLDWS